jgi:hypothetical protein
VTSHPAALLFAHRRRGFAALLLVAGLRTLVLLALPFAVLVRVSLELATRGVLPVWPALAAGVLATTLVLVAYVRWLARRVARPGRRPALVAGALLLLVSAWSAHAVAWLSAANAKSAEVRAFHASVHPVLRLAVSTLLLADPDLVITDTRREVVDYRNMGLPPNERSLHLVQANGWVHAIDLRTLGRPEWRNLLVRAYFAAMGFRTLRHVGTGDHLHVSLPAPPSGRAVAAVPSGAAEGQWSSGAGSPS